MGFRYELKKLIEKYEKIRPLKNDRKALMIAICLQELGWDADGFAYTEWNYRPIEKHMRFLER